LLLESQQFLLDLGFVRFFLCEFALAFQDLFLRALGCSFGVRIVLFVHGRCGFAFKAL